MVSLCRTMSGIFSAYIITIFDGLIYLTRCLLLENQYHICQEATLITEIMYLKEPLMGLH